MGDSALSIAIPHLLARGATLGRYVVLDVIGQGGMGVVYTAYDPELDRKLAIKLMRPEHSRARGGNAKEWLLREAQALARLSHPNVVSVHDVGTWGDQVFLAMEYVEGNSLRQWLRAEQRPWREILKVFLMGGRGLCAAHAAGIVHRDFKPENVLVAKSGRVCVLDFGLARQTDALTGSLTKGNASPDERTRSGALDVRFTRTGAFVGTPAYMSPEQLAGRAVDARSDQFSFCAALYEALCLEAPFTGSTVPERLLSITEGRVNNPRRTSRAPSWVRQALLRGLKANPDERYSNMDALLSKLERDPFRLHRRTATVTALVLLLSATAWSSYRLAQQRRQLCRGAQAKLAGVWDENQKSIISAAFLATNKPYAADALRGVSRRLDDYAQRWVAMQTEACEATRLRGEQSDELLDLRMACLSQRREELRSLTQLFASADANLVGKSINAAQGLSDISDCGKLGILRAPVKPPSDLQKRANVDELRSKLASIKALIDSGKYAEAVPLAASAVSAGEALHYRPVEAEALFQLGLSQSFNGDYRTAQKTLTDAVLTAESGRHDEIAARAWARLVWIAVTEAKYEETALWGKHATASIERLGGNDRLFADLLNSFGLAAKAQGKYDEALEYFRRSLKIAEHLKDDHQSWVALNNIGVVFRRKGQYGEALPYYQRALALKENTLGPAHPDVANTLINLGVLMRDGGKYDQALDFLNRSLQIKERALGTAHPSLELDFHNIGDVLRLQQEYEQAIPMFERALSFNEKALGKGHPNQIFHLTGLGQSYLGLNRPERAIPPLERALAISEKATVEPSILGEARFALARALRELRREPNRAKSLAEQARQAFIIAGAESAKDLHEVNQWLARKL